MDWIEIDDKEGHIKKFENYIKSNTTTTNYPKKNCSEKAQNIEHKIERLFVDKEKEGEKLKNLLSNQCNLKIKTPYAQLPNGLFIDDISEKTRIFPTGYFDIWAIDTTESKLCIFELKKASNTKVGIISELFFYAEFAKFVFLEKNENGKERFQRIDKNNKRGYDELQKILSSNKLNGIEAVFLVENLHPSLEEYRGCILKELNRSKQVHYSIIRYSESQIKP